MPCPDGRMVCCDFDCKGYAVFPLVIKSSNKLFIMQAKLFRCPVHVSSSSGHSSAPFGVITIWGVLSPSRRIFPSTRIQPLRRATSCPTNSTTFSSGAGKPLAVHADFQLVSSDFLALFRRQQIPDTLIKLIDLRPVLGVVPVDMQGSSVSSAS